MNASKNLIECGTTLPHVSKTSAIALYSVMLEKYPIVAKCAPNKWDFILTIAGIFIAISQLNHEDIPQIQKEKILDEVTRISIELYPDAIEACEDCRQFVDRTYVGLKNAHVEAQYLFSDSLGSWIVWNLVGKAPEDHEERELARVLGVMVVKTFVSWWK